MMPNNNNDDTWGAVLGSMLMVALLSAFIFSAIGSYRVDTLKEEAVKRGFAEFKTNGTSITFEWKEPLTR